MVGALDQVPRDFGEESFDLIVPGGICRGEVHVEPGVLPEPSVDRGVLVGAAVVTEHMHIEVVGDVLVDLGQELLEFRRPVPRVSGGNYRPSFTFIAANRLVVPCRK